MDKIQKLRIRSVKVWTRIMEHMRNTRAGSPRESAGLLSICIVTGLLSGSCKPSKPASPRPTTSIFVDKSTVKLGDEIRISTDRSLQAWSGEATVNTFRARLPIDSVNNVVRATRENGFSTIAPSEICVALKDGKGDVVPLAQACVRVNVAEPLWHLAPDNDTVPASGGSGQIQVRAPQEENWSLGSVPDWITVTKEVIAGIETVFHYQAAENHSYKHRSAA